MIEYELPDNWSAKTIEDVVRSAKNGGTPKRSNDSYWDGEIEWLSSGEIFGKELHTAEGSITQEGLEKSSAKIFPEDSVLVAMYGKTRGQSTILRNKMSGNQAICCLEVDQAEVTPEYLLYYLKNIKQKLKDEGRGGGQTNINQSVILRQEIPVPPLDEQERIVEAVEERLERVERLEKSVESVGNLTEEYEKSLLSFLTVGRDTDKKTSVAGTPEKSQLPDGWNATQLSEVANVNPRISYDEQKDYAYVPMDAVSANKKAIARYERRDSLYSGLAKFSQGDIVVARITPCFENGKMAIASDLPDGYEFAVGSTEFVVIRPTDIDTEYLFSYLKSPIVRQWGKHRLLGATGRERIKISQFRNELTVPVPPEQVQSQIVQNIKKNNFDKIRTSVNTVQDMFREYESSVLATAFNGNI